ncbi:MAG: flavodoxin, partial [Treponema sp.]|nr:flavodoxin [Treponema sp.]
ADLVRLYTRDEKKRSGLAKYAWGGAQVFMHKKPALKPWQFDPAAYDLIILGTPVWAASPAPPMQSFLSEAKISGKKIALFICHMGGKGEALKKFKSLLADNTVAGETDFIKPLAGSRDAVKEQLARWLKSLGL